MWAKAIFKGGIKIICVKFKFYNFVDTVMPKALKRQKTNNKKKKPNITSPNIKKFKKGEYSIQREQRSNIRVHKNKTTPEWLDLYFMKQYTHQVILRDLIKCPGFIPINFRKKYRGDQSLPKWTYQRSSQSKHAAVFTLLQKCRIFVVFKY